MKLATSTSDFSAYGRTPADTLGYLKTAGFGYADYNFGTDLARGEGFFGDRPQEYAERLALASEQAGVRLVQAHAPMGTPLAEDCDAFLEQNYTCIRACGRMGIKNLVVHSGYLPGLGREETFVRNCGFYARLLAEAEKHGVNILIENFNKMCVPGMYWIDNAPDLLEMVERVDHPLCHAVWDVGHANMQDMPQHEALRILGRHVYALHVQDNFGTEDEHLPPLFGTANMDSLMRGLLDIGYEGYFTFETGKFFSPPSVRRPYDGEERLRTVSVELRTAAERLLYEIGRSILSAYGCFEG